MQTDFPNVLGKESGSPEVREFIEKYGLDEVQDDPPFRRYQGSPQRGLDLLIEHERVEDIQIHLQGRKRYQAFAGTLPFGLQAGMTRRRSISSSARHASRMNSTASSTCPGGG